MIPISLFVFLTSWLSYPTSFWLRQRLKSSSSLNQSTSYVGVSRVDMCRQLSFNPQRRISAFQQNELRCQAPYVRMGCHRRITWLFEPSGSWNAESTRCLLISTMSSCRKKKKAYASITKKLLEKGKEIKQHKKTMKQMTGEGCDYVDEVCAASNKIHDLAGDS